MEASEQKILVIRHAQLAAALASGNESVIKEMAAIEAKLDMKAAQIADHAIRMYLRDY